MTETPKPAGWYVYPDSPGMFRYWDGSGWTDQIKPIPPRAARVADGTGAPGRPSDSMGEMAFGCLILLVVAGGLAFGIKAWTGSWWGVLVVPVALGLAAVVTMASAPENRGKVGCLSFVVAVLAIGAIFPAINGAGDSSPPAGPSNDAPTHDPNDGNIDHEDACNGLLIAADQQTDPQMRAGLLDQYDENCR